MAVVGTAYVRVKLLSDKMEADIERAVNRSVNRATSKLDDIGKDSGAKIGAAMGERINQGISESRISNTIEDAIEDGIGDADKSVPISPDAKYFWARMKFLTRPSFKKIVLYVDNKSLTFVSELVRRASGLRVLSDWVESFGRYIGRLDKSAPMLGGIVTGILGISGAVGALVGWLGLALSQLGYLAALTLPIPGLMFGAAFGIGTLFVALKDLKEVLAPLKEDYQDLGKVIKANFWDQAHAPVMQLGEAFRDMLQFHLPLLSNDLGAFIAKFAETAGSEHNMRRLGSIMDDTAEGTRNATKGVDSFVNGLIGLATFGATYLPHIGNWFDRLSKRFEEWVNTNVNNGNMFDWVEEGVTVFKTLWSVLGDLGGIIGGIGRAAQAAGGGGLLTVAASLDRLHAAIDSIEGQETLTKFFTATHDAAELMGDGIGHLFSRLGAEMDTIDGIIVKAGEIVGEVFAGIGDIISSEGFLSGLDTLLTGFGDFVGALRENSEPIGKILGKVGELAGTFMSNIGPVIGDAIAALEPLFTAFVDGVTPLIETLGDVLPGVIEDYLVPAVEKVAPVIEKMLSAFGGIPLLVVGAAAGIGRLASKFSGFLNVLPKDKDATGTGKFFTKIGKGFLGMLKLIKGHPVIAAISLIVSGLVWFFTQTETGQAIVERVWAAIQSAIDGVVSWWNDTAVPALTGAWDAIKGAAQAVVDFWNSNVAPVLERMWEAAQEAAAAFMEWWHAHVTPVFEALGELGAVIGEKLSAMWESIKGAAQAFVEFLAPIFAGLWEGILAGLEWLSGVWGVIWEALTAAATVAWEYLKQAWAVVWEVIMGVWEVFSGIFIAAFTAAWEVIKTIFVFLWESLKTVVEGALGVIHGIITAVTGAISGDWGQVWEGIKMVASSVWETITGVIELALGAIGGVISAGLGFISGVWNSIWSQIGGFLTSVWNSISSTATSVWGEIVSFISGIPGKIMAGLQALSDLAGKAREWFGAFLSAAKEKFNEAVEFARGIPGKIKGALGDLGGYLKSSGSALIKGFTDGITGAFRKAREAVSSGLGKIRGLFPFSPAKYGPFSGRGYTTFSGTAMMEDFSKGLLKGARGTASTVDKIMDQVSRSFSGEIRGSSSIQLSTVLSAGDQALFRAMSGRKTAPHTVTIGSISLSDVKTLDDLKNLLLESEDTKRTGYMMGASYGYSG